jgi:hypothetical protein
MKRHLISLLLLILMVCSAGLFSLAGRDGSAAGAEDKTPSRATAGSLESFEKEALAGVLPTTAALPDDPAFDRRFSAQELIQAWQTLDAGGLAAAAAGYADSQRILLRPRRGLSFEVVWQPALHVAASRRDRTALKTLLAAAENLRNKEYQDQARKHLTLAAGARDDQGVVIDAGQTTLEQFDDLKALQASIEEARLMGEVQFLKDLQQGLGDVQTLPQGAAERLLADVKETESAGDAASLSAAVRRRLNELSDASRGWGGLPSISPPQIDVPVQVPTMDDINRTAKDIREDIQRQGKDAREDIQRQGKDAREDVQRQGKDAREDIQRQGKDAREDIQRQGKKGREDLQRKTKSGETHAAEQAWGEAGRRFYPAAAGIMGQRWPNVRKLSTAFRSALAKHHLFNDIDLSRVNVHWGALPIEQWRVGGKVVYLHGKDTIAQTYGYEIYVKAQYVSPMDRERVETLVHELTHVQQFIHDHSSLENFGYTYFRDYKKANEDYYSNALEKQAYAMQGRWTNPVYGSYRKILRLHSKPRSVDPFLVGTWKTTGRTITFTEEGTCRVTAEDGKTEFRYQYDLDEGLLTGVDSSNRPIAAMVRRLTPDSIEWAGDGPRRFYVKAR